MTIWRETVVSSDVVRRAPKEKVKKPQPSAIQEICAIIQGFRTHPEYSDSADYVELAPKPTLTKSRRKGRRDLLW